ncbi:NAD(P)H-binding protein [Jannaschia donghaensis]|uniref:NAD(P)-binding domain-containing protein n=1 Tax=Jannaschia donghaensis TaxID=420998 RepID=A0A0M6YN62_9RHOB|nr:NAD(P)H-binding protein [Jannaschia donghaensis]CTQ51370.1 hypothetical protein JDO7802_03409 [Jannaschia donghaensis]
MNIVMIGATGAVGGHCAGVLARDATLTTLGRRTVDGLAATQHTIDLADPASYAAHLAGQDAAICCLGVGEPSKVSRDTLRRIDHDIPLAFAIACQAAGVRGFSILSSVGAHAGSRNFILRTKGQLEDGLRDLAFERISLFHPSMILTPTNRYGFTQAVTLAVWPWLTPILRGPLEKLRGIPVDRLGRAIARDALEGPPGEHVYEWARIDRLGAA